MATIKSKVFQGLKNIPQPSSACVDTVAVDVDFPSANVTIGDLVLLCTLPIGVTLQDYEFHFPDVDSNGTPTIAFSFGVMNAGLTDIGTAYATGVTAGQSNTVVRNTTTLAAQAATTAERVLGIKWTAAAATYAGSGLTGQVILRLRG